MSSKEKISQALVELVGELGLNGAATSKIADKAGVAIGTLFHHFPTKQSLIEAVFMELNRDYVEWLNTKINQPGLSLKKQIKIIIRESIGYWTERPEKFEFVYQVFHSRYYNDSIKERIHSLRSAISDVMRMAGEQKVLRNSESELLQRLIYDSILANVRLVISAPNVALRTSYKKEGQRFVWNAIKYSGKT